MIPPLVLTLVITLTYISLVNLNILEERKTYQKRDIYSPSFPADILLIFNFIT